MSQFAYLESLFNVNKIAQATIGAKKPSHAKPTGERSTFRAVFANQTKNLMLIRRYRTKPKKKIHENPKLPTNIIQSLLVISEKRR